MCGPSVAWDWMVLDVAYVLVLVGGGIVLRARLARPLTWLIFGCLSVTVGGFLLAATYGTQTQMTDLSRESTTVQMLASC